MSIYITLLLLLFPAISSGQERTAPTLTSLATMNPNISLVVNTYAYGSNLSREEREAGITNYTDESEGIRKGFTLESAELFIFAPADPYFNLYATIPVTEDGAELEEAYFLTTSLPHGLQVKGGKFKSSFGRLNQQHPHQWDFADIPLVYKAFLGEEGLTEKGVQVTYLPNTPFYTLLGAESLQGEAYDPEGGNKEGASLNTAFIKASADISENQTVLLGLSLINGNSFREFDIDGDGVSDDSLKGDLNVYGADLTYKWASSPYTGLLWQTEYLYLVMDETGSFSRIERNQGGLYTQLIGRFSKRWRGGIRYDLLDIPGDHRQNGIEASKESPWRSSAMAEVHFTEFSRLRLQFNHDESLDKVNREVYLQFTFAIGAHGAHQW